MYAEALRKPAAELTRADARSVACVHAMFAPALARGCTAPYKAAGFTTSMEFIGLVSPHCAPSSLCTFPRSWLSVFRPDRPRSS